MLIELLILKPPSNFVLYRKLQRYIGEKSCSLHRFLMNREIFPTNVQAIDQWFLLALSLQMKQKQ